MSLIPYHQPLTGAACDLRDELCEFMDKVCCHSNPTSLVWSMGLTYSFHGAASQLYKQENVPYDEDYVRRELMQAILRFDVDGDGLISFDEFVDMLCMSKAFRLCAIVVCCCLPLKPRRQRCPVICF